MLEGLRGKLRERGGQTRPLRIGSLCSGIEAPLVCLQARLADPVCSCPMPSDKKEKGCWDACSLMVLKSPCVSIVHQRDLGHVLTREPRELIPSTEVGGALQLLCSHILGKTNTFPLPPCRSEGHSFLLRMSRSVLFTAE